MLARMGQAQSYSVPVCSQAISSGCHEKMRETFSSRNLCLCTAYPGLGHGLRRQDHALERSSSKRVEALSAWAATASWYGDSPHAGSVLAASPVSKAAWQRQPPKSFSRSGQLRHGSRIQPVPRKRLNASDSSQIQRRDLFRTFSN